MSLISVFSVILNYKWVILFYIGIILLVYINRKKLTKEAAFVYLLKTQFGINLMDKFSQKFRKAIKIWGYIGIVLAYIGFFFISFELVKMAYDILIDKPGAVGGSPVIPGLPIAGLGITFPLVIGWISLFIIMIVHEFSHGIMARAHNVKVKSSGIAFFGPILGAFVEPDEKDLAKQPHKVQHSIFAAGPISNVLLFFVCGLLLMGIASAVVNMTNTIGVKIGIIQNETLPAYNSGISENSILIGINNYSVSDVSTLETALNTILPGQEVKLKISSGEEYSMISGKNPQDETKAYLGILILEEERKLKEDTFFNNMFYKVLLWLYELFNWTGFISINIGLINLFPIFITDGAQMLRKNFEYFFKRDKKKGEQIWKSINLFGLFILATLLLLPLIRNIFKFILGFIFGAI